MVLKKQGNMCHNRSQNTPKWSPTKEGMKGKIIFSAVTVRVI